MNKLKAIIIDDEEDGIVALTKQLEWVCPDIAIVASTTSPKDRILLILEHEIDILFLDIEMPSMNGFELLDVLGEQKFQTIFVTAYDQHAVKAFNTHAIAYLLKPIEEDLLVDAINKVRLKIEQRLEQSNLEDLIKSMMNNQLAKFSIPTTEGIEFVDEESIIRLHSKGSYTEIFLNDGAKHLMSKTMKSITERLSENYFIRPHHSHVVNMKYIKKYLRGVGGQLVLQDGTLIPVSRSKKSGMLNLLE